MCCVIPAAERLWRWFVFASRTKSNFLMNLGHRPELETCAQMWKLCCPRQGADPAGKGGGSHPSAAGGQQVRPRGAAAGVSGWGGAEGQRVGGSVRGDVGQDQGQCWQGASWHTSLPVLVKKKMTLTSVTVLKQNENRFWLGLRGILLFKIRVKTTHGQTTAIWSPLSFLIQPAKLEEIVLIARKSFLEFFFSYEVSCKDTGTTSGKSLPTSGLD